MNSGRREFLKATGLLAIGLSNIPLKLFGIESGKRVFSPRFGICTEITNISILESAGYQYLEEGVRRFLVPNEPETVFNEKFSFLKNAGIPVEACNSFLPGELKCVGPESQHENILLFSETAFRRAEIAGIKIIVFGSGGSRSVPDGFSKEVAKNQFIELGSKMATLAKKYNIIVCLEPLNSKECNFINSVSEGGEIVKAIGHENFQLLADIYHMRMENENPESIIKYGNYIKHVHIAEKEGRTAPGVSGEDFTPYLNALKSVGYEGRISIECNWNNLNIQAGSALQTLKSQIDKIG